MTRPRGDPEQIVAEERGEEIGEAAEVERRRREPAALQAGVAVPVVELSGFRLREHLVGLDDLAEALLGVRLVGNVGMQRAGQPAERLLDLGLPGGALDPEDLVVVPLRRRHRLEA